MRITGEFPDGNRQTRSREGIVHPPDMGPEQTKVAPVRHWVGCIGVVFF